MLLCHHSFVLICFCRNLKGNWILGWIHLESSDKFTTHKSTSIHLFLWTLNCELVQVPFSISSLLILSFVERVELHRTSTLVVCSTDWTTLTQLTNRKVGKLKVEVLSSNLKFKSKCFCQVKKLLNWWENAPLIDRMILPWVSFQRFAVSMDIHSVHSNIIKPPSLLRRAGGWQIVDAVGNRRNYLALGTLLQ